MYIFFIYSRPIASYFFFVIALKASFVLERFILSPGRLVTKFVYFILPPGFSLTL